MSPADRQPQKLFVTVATVVFTMHESVGQQDVRATWLSIIGIGDDGLTGLSPIARSLIDRAAILVGGQRHLAMIPDTDQRPKIHWITPFSASVQQIIHLRGRAVCVLASGDPFCYGVGSSFYQALADQGYLPINEMTIVPAPSAFSLACSRLGWTMNEIETISLCGRDLNLINGVIYPGAKILALSADGTTPGLVAQLLTDRGAGATQITVLEHLGGDQERLIQGFAQNWQAEIANLNTLALQCPLDIPSYARLPGLPDIAYLHDGQLTKREIRAITLASLAPYPGELLWDVGAGNGSIAIEWLRCHPRNMAIAIEQHPQRLQNITHNAATLGVSNLQLVAGKAPEILTDLPRPAAIFVGGGLTVPNVFEACWLALLPGGRLVANGVTIETEQRIFQLQQQYGGSLERIAIQRAEPVGNFLGWKALAPVTQWRVVKNI
jgi:precorrin-6B C5,15-methyltransferase / cobalt-precorrin-6B C5,C15-methyltransferase